MKLLKKHWSARPLSLLLSVLMALPLGWFLLRQNSVQAQSLATRQPTWAILDFANPSGYGSGDIGRLASDSFVVQLGKLNRYNVLPRAQLLTGIQDENLTPPLNLSSIERLGQSLGVDAIVAGEVSSISFSRDRRQAKVSIAVRVIDPKSGYLLNGALAEGLSNPRPIPVDDEEQLVNEAFGNAAFNAVKQLSKFALPVATVLISGNNTLSGHNVTVTINKGTRDGMYPGLDMLVSRNGLYVGTIRIAEPSDNDSNAEITDLGLGIEPGDRATAIFHMPSYTVDKTTGSYQTASSADLSADAPTTSSHSSAFKGVTGILLALISGGLLLAAIHTGHTGNDNSLGGANVSGVSAVAGRAANVGGGSTNLPAGYPATGSFIPVAVRIIASIGNINPTNFLEFHVYRSDSPSLLSNAANLVAAGVATTTSQSGNNGNTNSNTNTNGSTTGTTTGTNTNNNNNGGGGLLGINGFGQVPLFADASKSLVVYDDFNLKTAVTASKPDPSDSSTLVTLSVSTFGQTVPTTGTNPYVGGIEGTGLGFGQRVSYSVEGLYIQPATFNTGTINPGTGTNSSSNTNSNTNTSTSTSTSTSSSTTTGSSTGTTNTSGTSTNSNTSGTTDTTGHGETFQLTGLRTTNTVTYIEPVAPFGGSVTSTGSSNVNVTVPTTAGANDYILEISPDAGFGSSVKNYSATAGAYNVPNPQTNPNQSGATSGTISVASGTAVVFNNINLNTDFPGSTTLFYRVGARNSLDNGQAGYGNPYIFSDPLQIPIGLSGNALHSSIQALNNKRQRNRY